MPKYVFVVMTNPTDGQEAEYNRWYDNQHLPDVLKVEGFVAAQRFKLATADGGEPKGPHRYMALYEAETDDLGKLQKALGEAAGTDAMPMSPALETRGLTATWFEVAGERLLAR